MRSSTRRRRGSCATSASPGTKDPQIHLHTLHVAREHGFHFDAVQLPLNVMDAHYRSFEKLVLPELVKDGVGVLGMKPLAAGVIVKSGSVSALDCLRYALRLPTSVVITGIDTMEYLDQACEAARTYQSLTEADVRALLQRTARQASRGELEPFKTTSIFDATALNPAWLGEEPERVQRLVEG